MSKNWTVVGGNLGEQVIDEGENNKINGFNVNHTEAPFGQSIVDNLEEMREAMQSFKKPEKF
jgi:hypothetical protein